MPFHVLRRRACLAAAAALGAALAAGCSSGGPGTAASAPPSTAAGAPSPASSSPAAGASSPSGPPPSTPSASAPPAGTPTQALPTHLPPTGTLPTLSRPIAPPTTASDDCPGRPRSTHYIALYRYTTSGGVIRLSVRDGHYSCGDPANEDAATFVTGGPARSVPLDQAAYVTATNPITETSSNTRIGVQDLLDWLDANPDSGLVFTYGADKRGWITRLDEVYTA